MVAKQSESLIIPDQLRAAREDLALPIEDVARGLSIEPAELIGWENGSSEPSVERLWDLAGFYNRETDYFLRQTPSLPDHLDFRLTTHKAINDLPLEARRALVRFDELCRAESDLEQLLQVPRRIQVCTVTGEWSPEDLARSERQRLVLGERPIKDLRSLLTEQGIRIFELPVGDITGNELSGVSWWHQDYGPCILVNARDVPGRRSFTLAHEYAHLLRSDPPTVCEIMLDTAEERFANRFAAEFLMPASDVRKAFLDRVRQPGTIPSHGQLGSLARRYAVSLEATQRRLEELGLIARGSIEWEEARPGRFRRPKTPTWRRQLGDEFVSLALDAHSQRYISTGKLANYLGLDLRKVIKLAREHHEQRFPAKGA